MKGIYALVISVGKDVVASIGAMHEMKFDKGLYVYVGSAQTNLEKRAARHFSRTKRKFWHVDYLLGSERVSVFKVFYKKGARSEECKLAKELGKKGLAIKGFGSSDCKCESHLFRVQDYEFLREYMDELAL
jgi:Uri superfamily endonuclease